ncbi:MAG: GspB domain-containing protein [Desulfobacteraceae bacterium]|nr:GspB domain-containing protein [Desulfobacteraceae bacterium]
MSSILDALKKVEIETAQSDSAAAWPLTGNTGVTRMAARPGRRYVRKVLAGAVVTVLLSFGGWGIWSQWQMRNSAGSNSSSSSQSSSAKTEAVATARADTVTPPATGTPVPPVLQNEKNTTPSPADDRTPPGLDVSPETLENRIADMTPDDATEMNVSEASEAGSQRQPAAAKSLPDDGPARTSPSPAESAEIALETINTPEMPEQPVPSAIIPPTDGNPGVQAPIESVSTTEELEPAPSNIELQALVWAEDAADRFVVINNRIVRQGQVFDGYSIAEIQLDRVVIETGGQRFSLKHK